MLSPTTRRGHAERERHGALRSRALRIRCTPVTYTLHRTLPPNAPWPWEKRPASLLLSTFARPKMLVSCVNGFL